MADPTDRVCNAYCARCEKHVTCGFPKRDPSVVFAWVTCGPCVEWEQKRGLLGSAMKRRNGDAD